MKHIFTSQASRAAAHYCHSEVWADDETPGIPVKEVIQKDITKVLHNSQLTIAVPTTNRRMKQDTSQVEGQASGYNRENSKVTPLNYITTPDTRLRGHALNRVYSLPISVDRHSEGQLVKASNSFEGSPCNSVLWADSYSPQTKPLSSGLSNPPKTSLERKDKTAEIHGSGVARHEIGHEAPSMSYIDRYMQRKIAHARILSVGERQ